MYNVIVAYKQIREQVTNSQGSASSQNPKVKPNQRINHKIEPMRKHVQNTSHQISTSFLSESMHVCWLIDKEANP
jgi:hypothetical protein